MLRIITILMIFNSIVFSQTVMVEAGLAYSELLQERNSSQQFEPYAKFAATITLPVAEGLSIYLNPYWQRAFAADLGLWIDFPGRIQDLEGLNSFVAVGLSYLPLLNTRVLGDTSVSSYESAFGFALVAGVSIDLNDDLAATLRYTHHPIILPSFSQAFDISLGLRYQFGAD